MIFVTKSRYEFEQWHWWFAWRPVVVHEYPDGAKKWVWWQRTQRCAEYYDDKWGYGWNYKYRLPQGPYHPL